jgi:hypothetical protein
MQLFAQLLAAARLSTRRDNLHIVYHEFAYKSTLLLAVRPTRTHADCTSPAPGSRLVNFRAQLDNTRLASTSTRAGCRSALGNRIPARRRTSHCLALSTTAPLGVQPHRSSAPPTTQRTQAQAQALPAPSLAAARLRARPCSAAARPSRPLPASPATCSAQPEVLRLRPLASTSQEEMLLSHRCLEALPVRAERALHLRSPSTRRVGSSQSILCVTWLTKNSSIYTRRHTCRDQVDILLPVHDSSWRSSRSQSFRQSEQASRWKHAAHPVSVRRTSW